MSATPKKRRRKKSEGGITKGYCWWVYALAIGIPSAHSALCPACGHVDWLTAFRAFFGVLCCPSCWSSVTPKRAPWVEGQQCTA